MLEKRIARWEEEVAHKGIMLETERGRAEGFVLGEEKGLLIRKLPCLKYCLLAFTHFRKNGRQVFPSI